MYSNTFSKHISVSIKSAICTLKCTVNLGVFERGNALTVAEGMNQLNCRISFTIFWGECVTCNFGVCFDLEPDALAALEVLCSFVHPEEQGNPFWLTNSKSIYTGIPPKQQQSLMKHMCMEVLTASNPVRGRGARRLDNELYSSCGEDKKCEGIFSEVGASLSAFHSHSIHTQLQGCATSRRHLTSSCKFVFVHANPCLHVPSFCF